MSEELKCIEELRHSVLVLTGFSDSIELGDVTVGDMRQVLAEYDRMAADLAAAEEENRTSDALIMRQSALLTGVVNAIRGEPAPLARHSHHDAVELVQALVARVRALEAVAEDEVAVERAVLAYTDCAMRGGVVLRAAIREALRAAVTP